MAKIRLLLVLLLVCLTPTLASAAASEGERKEARAFIESKQKQLTAAVKGGKKAQVDTIFDSMFDYDQLAKDSLRDHWASCTEAQRKEFTALLRTLVKRAYQKNVDRTLDYSIDYEGVTDSGKGVLVKTRAKSKKDAREEPLAIDYVVIKTAGVLRVHDVVTEGSSLVNNYRKNFNRVIKKKGGIDGLLAKMRERAAQDT